MTQNEINHQEWSDPRNWKGGLLGIYHSRRDTRSIVPKRNPAFGWTLNTARPGGMAIMVLLLGLVIVGVAQGIGGR